MDDRRVTLTHKHKHKHDTRKDTRTMGNREKLNSSQTARLQHLKRVADGVNHCQTCVPPPKSVASKTFNGHAGTIDSLEFAFFFPFFCQNSRLQMPSHKRLQSATYMDDVYGLGDGNEPA